MKPDKCSQASDVRTLVSAWAVLQQGVIQKYKISEEDVKGEARPSC